MVENWVRNGEDVWVRVLRGWDQLKTGAVELWDVVDEGELNDLLSVVLQVAVVVLLLLWLLFLLFDDWFALLRDWRFCVFFWLFVKWVDC